MDMNVIEIRNSFPHIGKGIIYFNHASTGPICKPVIEKIDEILTERSEIKPDEYLQFLAMAVETKGLLAEYLSTQKDRIAFTDNTSNGLNILAQGIVWNKGDKIILNDIEFPANVYPFLNLQKKGVEIHFVKSSDGIISAEDIINSADEKTKLISVSFVQFLSGYKIDLEKLGDFCKNNNIILSVDAIQGLGALQLDVRKCNIDFLSSGVQKWLLGLQGLAFIYLSEKLQSEMEPAYLGWLSVENAWDLLDFELIPKSTAQLFQTGTVNTLGIYALNTVLKILKQFGFGKIENNIIDHTLFLRNRLNTIGMKLYPENLEEKSFSGIVTFKHPDAEGLFNWLSDRKIFTSLREGMIRLSPHFYNTEEEIESVADACRNYRSIILIFYALKLFGVDYSL
jgi:cysteine desulfurase / selenocysteine lyase